MDRLYVLNATSVRNEAAKETQRMWKCRNSREAEYWRCLFAKAQGNRNKHGSVMPSRWAFTEGSRD